MGRSLRARNVPILSAVPRGNVLLAALCLSAVAACSDPKAGTLPTASPTPSSVSPTPSASASVDLAGSLRSALQAYFDALYAAGMDPANKTDALAALIAPSCTCYRAVDVLREEARKGRHIDYSYTLSDIQVIEVGSLGGNVRYTVAQSAGALRDSSGRVIKSYPASQETYSAHFARRDSRWIVDRIERYA